MKKFEIPSTEHEWVHISEVRKLNERIQELEAELEAMERAAHTDYLTGTLNRRGFELLMAQEWERVVRSQQSQTPETFTMLAVDMDAFKSINDLHGHAAGDRALQTVATRARTRLRDSDILGRIGGDEFAICLIGAGEEEALTISHELLTSIEETTIYADTGIELNLSLSFGIAEYQADESWQTVLERADSKLLMSKAT